MQDAKCYTQNATCKMLHAKCYMQNATCYMLLLQHPAMPRTGGGGRSQSHFSDQLLVKIKDFGLGLGDPERCHNPWNYFSRIWFGVIQV